MIKNLPDDLKQKALQLLETQNVDTVAATLRIRKAALLQIIQDRPAPQSTYIEKALSAEKTPSTEELPTAEKPKRYTPEYKTAALAMMEEKGAVATIKALGISSYTLYDWKRKAEGKKYPGKQGPLAGKERKRYAPEFKAEVIEYYQSCGALETLQKYGIVSNSLYNWLDEAGIACVGNPRASDHTAAIALYQDKGLEDGLEEYGITRATLRDWLKDAGIDTARSSKYSPEVKASAVSMTEQKPLTTVAKELGVPASTLATWKTDSKTDPKLK